tara:strand:- start:199 stop:303 length:105 start_codon:yes stop_codon:yes gene_type:complete
LGYLTQYIQTGDVNFLENAKALDKELKEMLGKGA